MRTPDISGGGYTLYVDDWGQNNADSCEENAGAPVDGIVTSCPAWVANKAWLPGDVVRHQTNLYVARQFHEDTAPPAEGVFWKQVMESEVSCSPGREPILPSRSNCPMWVNGSAVNQGDIFLFRGTRYQALVAGNMSPSQAPENWNVTNATCFSDIQCPTTDPNAASYPVWSSSNIYYAGDVVSHNELVWSAKWWTQNNEPSVGEGAWTLVSDVELPWDSLAVYLAGEEVNHLDRRYRARWWTRGNEPGVSDAWEDVGAAACPSATQ